MLAQPKILAQHFVIVINTTLFLSILPRQTDKQTKNKQNKQ